MAPAWAYLFAMFCFTRRAGSAGCVSSLLLFCLLVGLPCSAQAGDPFRTLLDSVVRLDVWKRSFTGGREATVRVQGSGVIVDSDGHILTNAHVCDPYAERIRITLNSLETVEARFIGWDHWTDLALVRLDLQDLERRGVDFSHGVFGDSEALEAGTTVFAVGTPNGLTRTVTRGIISNTQRFFRGRSVGVGYETGDFNTWLQTDAAINPGNSGGPLVLDDGSIIGINTRAYLGANNLAFAVPGNVARAVLVELLDRGHVERSYVGLTPGPLRDLEGFFRLDANEGMLIENVDPGSPADLAGIRPGDIIMSIDGETVDGRYPEQLPSLLNRIASKPVGSVLRLTRLEANASVIEMRTERLESRVGELAAFESWGLSVQRISRAVAREEKLETADGVRVVGVQPGFPGDEVNLRSGDIILEVGGTVVDDIEILREAHRRFQANGERVLLELRRSHQSLLKVLASD